MSYRDAQKAEKLKIEEFARKKLDGALLKNFEILYDFLKQEKINCPWVSINGFRMKYKSKNIGTISFLGDGDWDDGIIEIRNHWFVKLNFCEWSRVEGEDKFAEEIFKEELQDIVWNNIVSCRHCYPADNPCSQRDSTKIILGKEIKNICGSSGKFHLHITNPKENEINGMKKLLGIIKSTIEENK